jgi:hypothetical protein
MTRAFVSALLGLATVTAGCAAGDLQQSNAYRGDSGPVNWEVVGIRTNLSDDARRIQWDFTVILRETAGRAIQFEQLETSAQGSGHPDALMAGVHQDPFRLRLAARDEYRFNMNYSLTFVTAAGGGFGDLPGGHGGVTVLYRLKGLDESGQSVTVAIPVALHPGAGSRVRRPVTAREQVSPTLDPTAKPPAAASAETRPRETPSPNPARQAADDCASRSRTLRILDVGEAGNVNFEHAPGEDQEFLACFKSTLRERTQGRLLPVSDGLRSTTVAIEPLGTHFVVVAMVGATQRVRLLVDTGASMTIVRPHVIEGLDGVVQVDGYRPRITVATGDTVNIRLARLRSFAVGDFEVEDLHVGLYDVAPQLDIDGLLGTDFLHRFVFNVDGGARRLSLERKP